MAVQLPFNPLPKQDSPERLAMIQAFGPEYYADAEFMNTLIDNMNHLFELFQVAQGRRIIKVVAGTSYTVIAEDFDKLLVFTNALPIAVSISTGLDFNIYGIQRGNGQVSFSGNAGVTVVPPVDSYAKTESKGAVIALLRINENDFSIIGKLQLI